MTANTSLAGGPATRRRRISSSGFRVFTYASLILIIAPAVWILLGVLFRALAHWRWDVLWTPLTAEGGGLRDQILGTLLLMAGVLVLAGTIGVLAGIHLSEMAKVKKNGKPSGGLLRTASDILSGFPSIVLGYVGYAALVLYFGWGFSYLAAVIVLSVMVVPYIAKQPRTRCARCPPATGRVPKRWGCRWAIRCARSSSDRAAGHRHRTPPGARHRRRRDGAAHLHGELRQQAAPLRDARLLPLPDLRRVLVLRLVTGLVPLPRLRRRSDPRGDGVAAPGGQPHSGLADQRHAEGSRPGPRLARPRPPCRRRRSLRICSTCRPEPEPSGARARARKRCRRPT